MKTNNQHSYPSWLVSVEIAKQLKEIGFDKPCIFSYSEGIGVTACLRSGAGDEPYFSDFVVGGNSPGSPYVDLPAWGQVFEWFREKGLHSYVRMKDTSRNEIDEFYKKEQSWEYMIYLNFDDVVFYSKEYYEFSTYEKAMESLVEDLIDYYKEHYKKEIDERK